MDTGLLETLVKLAALGAAGVCIFAIFWIGWLILHLPEGATPERHKTLRAFMVTTVFIAIISAAAGFLNSKFNADKITNAERLRDPLLKLPLLYWYELRASFTGVYQASIARAESRRIDGKLKPTGVVDTIQLDPYWFKFYSSLEAAGGGSSGKGSASPGSPKKEFELRPRFLPEKKENGKLLWPTWIWFLGRAPGRLFGVVFGTFFFFWFMFLGGSSIAMESFLGSFSAMAEAQQTEAKQKQTPLKKTAADSLVDSIKSIENVETKDAITSEIYKLSEAIHEMEEENRELKELAEKATAEVEQYKIEKDVRDEMVTGIFGSHVVLASGQRVKLGQKIRFGPLAGRKVVSIDKDNRLVDFGNDVFGSLGKPVWMRHDPRKDEIQATDTTAKRPTTISKELPEIRKSSPEKAAEKNSQTSLDQYRGHEH